MRLELLFIIFYSLSSAHAGISEEKCRQYEELAYKPKVCTSMLPHGLGDGDCTREPDCDNSAGLIAGGEEAKAHEFPHFTLLGYDYRGDWKFLCGGSLISEKFILTAAHCRVSNDNIKASLVRLGETDLSALRNNKVADHTFPPENFIPHPNYSARNYKNDIALIKLMTNVKFSKQVRPACLHQNVKEVLRGKTAVAIGFGATSYAGDSSERLLKVNLTVIQHSECNPHYIEQGGIEKNQLCVQGKKVSAHEFADTCQGDSGGPLQFSFTNNPCMFNLIGITSYGGVCGYGVPAIYTRISSYLSWIEGIVWP